MQDSDAIEKGEEDEKKIGPDTDKTRPRELEKKKDMDKIVENDVGVGVSAPGTSKEEAEYSDEWLKDVVDEGNENDDSINRQFATEDIKQAFLNDIGIANGKEDEGNGTITAADHLAKVEVMKQKGNEAFTEGDVCAAVEHWNSALKSCLKASSCGSVSTVSAAEKALYLNLALGYLKLEQPSRALRATQCVLHEDPLTAKALYRSTEACIQMRDYQRAKIYIKPLEEVDKKSFLVLDQKLRMAEKNEKKKESQMNKKMFAATQGISDTRKAEKAVHIPDSSSIIRVNDELLERTKEIEKKKAEANGEKPIEAPQEEDEEARAGAFREQIMKKTQKYASAQRKYSARKDMIAERARIVHKVKGANFAEQREEVQKQCEEISKPQHPEHEEGEKKEKEQGEEGDEGVVCP